MVAATLEAQSQCGQCEWFEDRGKVTLCRKRQKTECGLTACLQVNGCDAACTKFKAVVPF